MGVATPATMFQMSIVFIAVEVLQLRFSEMRNMAALPFTKMPWELHSFILVFLLIRVQSGWGDSRSLY